MPRYFFDTDINGQCLVDNEGVTLVDLQSARHEALTALYALAGDIEADPSCMHATVRVRDNAHTVVVAVDMDVTVSMPHT